MKNKVSWFEASLVIAPFIAIAICWHDLPARVPIHWDLRGRVDGFGATAMILITPTIGVLSVALMHLLPRIDRRLRSSLDESNRMHSALRVLGVTFAGVFAAVTGIQLAVTLGYPLDVGKLLPSCVLILLMVCGNYSGALRPNRYIGIRTPWTLKDSETWRATHRLGGRLMFFGALLLLPLQFFVSAQVFMTMFVWLTLALLIWSVVYSRHHYRKTERDAVINRAHASR